MQRENQGLVNVLGKSKENRECAIVLRPVSDDEVEIAELVSSTGEARLISGECTDRIEPAIVAEWVSTSEFAIVLTEEDRIVGLGTLSVSEARLPGDCVEICHVLVAPNYRRRYKGSLIILNLLGRARDLGFKRAVGRVVPLNVTSHAILSSLRWRPMTAGAPISDGEFVWYEKSLCP